jgi:hypothetical protein
LGFTLILHKSAWRGAAPSRMKKGHAHVTAGERDLSPHGLARSMHMVKKSSRQHL